MSLLAGTISGLTLSHDPFPGTSVGAGAGGKAHSKSNWTRPVAFGLTGLARGEHVRDGSANVY